MSLIINTSSNSLYNDKNKTKMYAYDSGICPY